jgi:amino acid transporter
MDWLNQRVDAVRLPSFSIAEMMAIVALVALDCMAIRVGSPLTVYCLVLGGLPMQGALVVGLVIVFRRRREREKLLPFLTGFVVVGWICHLIYLSVCVQSADPLTLHLKQTLLPVENAMGFRRFSTADTMWNYVIAYGLTAAYLTILQLIPALVGGWICHWWSKTNPSELHSSND